MKTARLPMKMRASRYQPAEDPPELSPSRDVGQASSEEKIKSQEIKLGPGQAYNWVGFILSGAVKVVLRSGELLCKHVFGQCAQLFERGMSVEAAQLTSYIRVDRQDYQLFFKQEEEARNSQNVRILQNSLFFKSLLAGFLQIVTVVKGQLIYDNFSQPDTLYFIRSGQVRLSLVTFVPETSLEIENYQRTLRKDWEGWVASRGCSIGVDGILIGTERAYEVTADSSCELLTLDRTTFVSLYNSYINSYDIIKEESEDSFIKHTQAGELSRIKEFSPPLPQVATKADVIRRQAEERRVRVRSLAREKDKIKKRQFSLPKEPKSKLTELNEWLVCQNAEAKSALRRRSAAEGLRGGRSGTPRTPARSKRQIVLSSLPNYSINSNFKP